jgi:hypothetical protein
MDQIRIPADDPSESVGRGQAVQECMTAIRRTHADDKAVGVEAFC